MCQCSKISTEDSLSLMDLLSAELDDDTSEDITTRNFMGCFDVRSEKFCKRFKTHCVGSGSNNNFMLKNCRWTCGCV